MIWSYTEKKETELNSSINTVHIFSQDIGMNLGLANCKFKVLVIQ